MDKKTYIYSAIAIGLSVVAYYYITKKPKNVSSTLEGTPSTNDTITPTGEIITTQQNTTPDELLPVLTQTSANASNIVKGKAIYTKLDNVKVRNENYVNNGFFDNLMSTISNKGTLLGNVIEVVDDKGKLHNSKGNIIKWFVIKPSQDAITDMNKNKSFLTSTFSTEHTPKIYVREDVVTLKK